MELSSCVHSYHVYGEAWTAVLGEQVFDKQEFSNVINRYTMQVIELLSIGVVQHRHPNPSTG